MGDRDIYRNIEREKAARTWTWPQLIQKSKNKTQKTFLGVKSGSFSVKPSVASNTFSVTASMA